MNAVIKKRNGAREEFNPFKLHSAIFAACLSVKAYEGEAQIIARNVLAHMYNWLEDKVEVTSDDIRRVAAEYLERYHEHAAYIYGQQNIIL